MGTREREQQALDEQQRLEQAKREEQERSSASVTQPAEGQIDTINNPVIINR